MAEVQCDGCSRGVSPVALAPLSSPCGGGTHRDVDLAAGLQSLSAHAAAAVAAVSVGSGLRRGAHVMDNNGGTSVYRSTPSCRKDAKCDLTFSGKFRTYKGQIGSGAEIGFSPI